LNDKLNFELPQMISIHHIKTVVGAIHAIRTHDLSVGADEDSSCFRQRSDCGP
jgi:hypothetical protein